MTFNVTDGIRNAARLHPTSPAVICGMPGVDARSIDYATLDRILDAIGARLIGEGLAPGASVDIPTRDALALLLIKLASGTTGELCTDNSYALIDKTVANWEPMLQIALAAYLSGKTVDVRLSGCAYYPKVTFIVLR